MISIVIPNYNGRDLLARNLPAVLDAARQEAAAEVLVVDDGSTDESVGLLVESFPSVRRVVLSRNEGFGPACLAGAREAGGEILVLLNSDVVVEPGFLAPLREGLRDETVFAVGAVDRNIGEPGAPREVNRPCFRRGFLVDVRREAAGAPPYETFYVPAGYAAYRRSLFMELGGFDPLLEPFYWEDLDICYRAWKRGWRTLVDPRSIVRHEHDRGTIVAYHARRRIRIVARRNRFLYVWKNVTSRPMLFSKHLAPVTLRLLLSWAVLDFGYYHALALALGRLRGVREARRRERRAQKTTDEALFLQLGAEHG